MVSMLASRVVDCVLKPRSDQTKKTIKLVDVSFLLSMQNQGGGA